MAVVGTAKENWKQRTAEASVEGSTATRVFTVAFDGTDDPERLPVIALTASGIPAAYTSHPQDIWLYVQRKTSRQTSPNLVEVTCHYGYPRMNSSSASPVADPLAQEPQVNWTFAAVEEAIDRDINDAPITNSAGLGFDPPITKEFHDLILRVDRNEPQYDRFAAAEMIGTVNDSNFLGYDRGTVKCTMFNGERVRDAHLVYWRVTYEFQIRWDGWKRKIADKGFATKDSEGHWKVIKDGDNRRLAEEAYLDGKGGLLANPGVQTTTIIKREFEIYKYENFSAFNIPTSILGL